MRRGVRDLSRQLGIVDLREPLPELLRQRRGVDGFVAPCTVGA
jgi:hypothetical protein